MLHRPQHRVEQQLRQDGSASISSASDARAWSRADAWDDTSRPSAAFDSVPMRLNAPSRLMLNVATMSGGKLLVEVLGSSGHAAANCTAIVGDHTNATVVWDGGPGGPGNVSLRFLMFGEVDIYSFWWESEETAHPLANNEPPRAKAGTATLSNVELPLDQNGEKLVTGEADVLKHGDTYFLYFNNFGDCPGVDCCKSSAGCATCCFADPPSQYIPGCGTGGNPLNITPGNLVTHERNSSDPYGFGSGVQHHGFQKIRESGRRAPSRSAPLWHRVSTARGLQPKIAKICDVVRE